MSTNASVESTSSKAPVLMGGDVTPAIMMKFEIACHNFFESKSVPAEKQVMFILPRIKDFHICNWIATDHATIVALPFISFMTQLCKNSLHPDWEDHVCNEILQSCLQPSNESFWAWSQNIIELNCLLRDTTSLFDDTTLCNQLDAHLDDDLIDCVKHSDAKKEKTLKTWINTVHRLDETCISKNKRHHELIEETLTQHQSKRQAMEVNALCNKTNGTNNNTSSATASSTSSYVPVPTLLDSKHTLLNEHDGCMKCRKFYVEHWSRNCPNGFPQGKGYNWFIHTMLVYHVKHVLAKKTSMEDDESADEESSDEETSNEESSNDKSNQEEETHSKSESSSGSANDDDKESNSTNSTDHDMHLSN